MKSKIESLLFVSTRPLSDKKIAELIGDKLDEVKKRLEELFEEYKSRDGGIVLLKNGNEYEFASAPSNAEIVGTFLKEETEGELTRPQLETLSVIAYRGPITKPELEQIRGVNCSLILRNLLIRGLVEEESEKIGEQKYKISFEFLKFLGAKSVEELPDFQKLSSNEIIQNILQQDQKLKTKD